MKYLLIQTRDILFWTTSPFPERQGFKILMESNSRKAIKQAYEQHTSLAK